jgi:hypothetical protein
MPFLFGWKFVQNLRVYIYLKSFRPKWSFVKLIPGRHHAADDVTLCVFLSFTAFVEVPEMRVSGIMHTLHMYVPIIKVSMHEESFDLNE